MISIRALSGIDACVLNLIVFDKILLSHFPQNFAPVAFLKPQTGQITIPPLNNSRLVKRPYITNNAGINYFKIPEHYL